MRMILRDRLALVLAVIFVVCALAALAQSSSQYFSGIRLGARGLSVTAGNVLVQDSNLASKFVVAGSTGNTSIAGTLAVTGTTQLVKQLTGTLVAENTDAVTLTSSYYGKTTFVSGDFAFTCTLPANGAAAGSWMRFVINGTNTCAPTFAAATADTLITFNDATADSVTFGTGHRIGASILFISDGAKWIAVNEGNHTMTVAT